MNRELGAKIVYWTFCTFLILSLFGLLFGGLATFLQDSIDHVKVFAYFFSAIGVILMMLAVHSPGMAWKSFMRGPKGIPETGDNHRLMLFVFGACFVIGSLLYSYTGNISAVIGLCFIAVIVIRILA